MSGNGRTDQNVEGLARTQQPGDITDTCPSSHAQPTAEPSISSAGQESDSRAGEAETEDDGAHPYLRGQVQSSSLPKFKT